MGNKGRMGVDITEKGRVLDIRGGVITVEGLPNCAYGEVLDLGNGEKGLVIEFDREKVLALHAGKGNPVRGGDEVISRGEILCVPVSDALVGRIVNSFSEPVDGFGPISSGQMNMVFNDAPPIMHRVPITETLRTGIKTVDTMIPLGKGQRELIIGDRQTGKTTIATDTVINQRGQGVICVYCWIGGAYNAMVKVIETLRGKKAFDYTVFLAAPASATPTEQYIAPYSAAAIGEYFMGQGKDVLVIFDNLTIHAWIYRQISLILQRSPGREAYPGDIFFVHSQLLERAGRLDPSRGGSMSFLPIVDTLQGDITGYIQTNLISITDGQIFTSSTLFNEGFKPAIDIGYSVSRIGSKVQSKGIRRVSSKLRMEYTQFRELEKLTKLRTKVSAEMAAKISHGTALVELLIQPAGAPVPEAVMIMVFFAYNKGFLDNMDKEALGVFQREAAGVFAKKYPEEYAELEKKRELSADISGKLDEILGPFCAEIMTERNR